MLGAYARRVTKARDDLVYCIISYKGIITYDVSNAGCGLTDSQWFGVRWTRVEGDGDKQGSCCLEKKFVLRSCREYAVWAGEVWNSGTVGESETVNKGVSDARTKKISVV